MLNIFRFLCAFAVSLASPILSSAAELESGRYTVTQSWSQEQDFERTYFVHAPESAEPLPLFIFLHGNGGNAEKAMAGFTKRNKELSKRYNMVFAQGYLKSWNIVSERSQAPDREFIEAIEEMDVFSYLEGAVIHYKMKTRAHNAGGGLTEAMLLECLNQTNDQR